MKCLDEVGQRSKINTYTHTRTSWAEHRCVEHVAGPRPTGREKMVAEVLRIEKGRFKAVSHGREGGWTTWEGVTSRNISWTCGTSHRAGRKFTVCCYGNTTRPRTSSKC